jgi:hypothetical protein
MREYAKIGMSTKKLLLVAGSSQVVISFYLPGIPVVIPSDL